MPATTWLSDNEAREWSSLPDDKDCDELLQTLRRVSGRVWVIGRDKFVPMQSFWQWVFRRWSDPVTLFTLYLDCHGEWQVMNLVTPEGGSNFHSWEHSREAVMNYMLGYIGGVPARHEAGSQ